MALNINTSETLGKQDISFPTHREKRRSTWKFCFKEPELVSASRNREDSQGFIERNN